VPPGGLWQEVLNTDASAFGGSDMGNGGVVEPEPVACHGRASSVVLTLPPLAVVAFRKL
jgi:1,4-alpha-glucan branching enzyme